MCIGIIPKEEMLKKAKEKESDKLRYIYDWISDSIIELEINGRTELKMTNCDIPEKYRKIVIKEIKDAGYEVDVQNYYFIIKWGKNNKS